MTAPTAPTTTLDIDPSTGTEPAEAGSIATLDEGSTLSGSRATALIAAAAFSASANISTDAVIEIARKFEVYLDGDETEEASA